MNHLNRIQELAVLSLEFLLELLSFLSFTFIHGFRKGGWIIIGGAAGYMWSNSVNVEGMIVLVVSLTATFTCLEIYLYKWERFFFPKFSFNHPDFSDDDLSETDEGDD